MLNKRYVTKYGKIVSFCIKDLKNSESVGFIRSSINQFAEAFNFLATKPSRYYYNKNYFIDFEAVLCRHGHIRVYLAVYNTEYLKILGMENRYFGNT